MRNSNKPGESCYNLLKNEIRKTFGTSINSSRECLELSDQIFKETSFKINSNTLRRFFGLVKSHYQPANTTLNILSQYCGYTSFDELLTLKTIGEHVDSQGNYEESILSYLTSLFTVTPFEGSDNKTFNAVVKQAIFFIQRHPEITVKFQQAISKTDNGRHFYFEQFINFDELNSFYGDGLQYYLLEKNKPEAQILGNSLLCLRNWLCENSAEVKRHYHELIKYRDIDTMHPFLYGLFFASQLLHADVYKLPTERIIEEAHELHRSGKYNVAKDKYRLYPCFEYAISPILVLTGNAEEALYYTNYANCHYPINHSSAEPGGHQTMKLFETLAFIKTGNLKEAYNVYQHIRPAKFYFSTKKLNTIIYLFLSEYLNKSSTKLNQQLSNLIAETGFSKLSSIAVAG